MLALASLGDAHWQLQTEGADTLAGQTVSLVDMKKPASPENSDGPSPNLGRLLSFATSLSDPTLRYSPGPLCYSPQWDSYPDVLAMQFNWDGYYKEVGSAFIGSSPEFEFALYSLCFIARPGKV